MLVLKILKESMKTDIHISEASATLVQLKLLILNIFYKYKYDMDIQELKGYRWFGRLKITL